MPFFDSKFNRIYPLVKTVLKMSEEVPAYLFTFYALRSPALPHADHPDALNEIHQDGEGKTRLKNKIL